MTTAPTRMPRTAQSRPLALLATAAVAALGVWLLAVGTAHAAAPTISNVSPASGPQGGGTVVTITGSNFVDGATDVLFDGVEALSVSVASASTLTATTPPRAPGAVSVTVVVAGEGSVTQPGAFAYQGPPPTISSISPTSGPTTGGTSVTITGTNFASGATVLFAGTPATGITVANSTTITATTPARPAGSAHVTVTSADGQSATLNNGFTFETAAAPTISSVAPASGPTTGGTNVTITGTNFAIGATVTFAGTNAASVVRVNATTITARTPARASAGAVAVAVRNPDNQTATLSGGFTYTAAAAPTISAVSPNGGPRTGGTTVTITGTNFASGATVAFGGTAATNVVVVNSTTITARTPARASNGRVNVVVTNPDGRAATLSNGFEYRTATVTVTSITPNSGPVAGGTSVTIQGTGFVTGTTVRIGGGAATSVVIVNETTITAITGAGTAGRVDVVVTVPASSAVTLAGGFRYLGARPTITSISPSSGPITGGTEVTLRGTNFASGLTVAFGGTNGTGVTRVSDTEVRVRTPARASEGGVQVILRNPDEQTAESFFLYSRPQGTIVSGSINTTGLALIVFSGGTTQQLTDAVASGGCPTARQAIYTTVNGRWIVLIPGAPAQVNAEWNSLFGGGLATNVPLLVRCL